MNRFQKLSLLMILLAAGVFSLYSFAQTQTQPQTQAEEKKDMKFVKAPNSSAPAGVKFAITDPTDGMVVPGPDVTVKFTIENWKLYKDEATQHGQHIHFILDNEPYIAHYSTDPFVFKNVAPGPHVIRAFPSRPWHESVKQDTAFSMVQIFVKEKTGTNLIDPAKEMLVYSRPKGEYSISKPPVGQPVEGVMIDFFAPNITLGQDGFSGRVTVDGLKRFKIESWQPYYVQGLAPGSHTFKLELLRDGTPVEGNFNTTERTITLNP
jgi:hypothetical protein